MTVKHSFQLSLFRSLSLGARRAALPVLLLWLLAALPPARAEFPAPTGVIQFLDGSILQGELRQIEAGHALRWKHPFINDPIAFNPSNIDYIRFRSLSEVPEQTRASGRFRFTNGDEVLGKLLSMDGETVRLECSYGSDGVLTARRESLQAVNFLSGSSAVLYDGPTGIEGWVVAGGPGGWRYRDGAFTASGGINTLGRDFKLRGSSRIEFDLAWSGPFNLLLVLYTPSVERVDYGSSSYMLHINQNMMNLQRIQAGAGTMSLGHVPMGGTLRNNKARFEIRANKEEAVWSIYLNGMLLQEWKDNAGFAAKGTGILFSAQGRDGPQIELSNIKVSDWDWKSEVELSEDPAPAEDWVFLANRDKVAGSIKGIGNGNVSLQIHQTELQIPLERVTRIHLRNAPEAASAYNPWLVRAHFFSGEQIAFQLEEWSGEQILGSNEHFGPVALAPRTVRMLEFNPDRPRADRSTRLSHDDFWDFE